MKRLFLISIAALVLASAYRFKPGRGDDGPYIFTFEKNIATWIENGNLNQKEITHSNFKDFKDKFGFIFEYRDLLRAYPTSPDFKQQYRNADSICVISDIHGEFKKYVKLLGSQGVIDNNLNWKFGKGHLVVLGDYFDRGDQVTEILWHLFGLEKQAGRAGGMVHVLLGNHELMLFNEDLSYLNPKYKVVEELTGKHYHELYGMESILGKWLRHRPVMISIGDMLFVHGGISTEMIRKNLSVEEINKLFYQMLVLKQVESDRDIDNLVFLNEDSGPVWYRGFFLDENFSESCIDSVLTFYKKKQVVVGHTTAVDFQYRFDGKIIGIDAGLGADCDGAVLIRKKNQLYKGLPSGKRTSLSGS